MLYTFSQAHYSETELQRYLTEITENDAVVLWQDGVLLAVNNQVRSISLADLVDLTAQYSPQIAL